ncbi:hypothetical protein [Nostoc favosum]|uniref:Uncharacterized protein n=1 Tax=Nostoc favosum CHAB5714 TaxID=2780399 RepID=A0ABS8IIV4_9NOSO|nr:hypothetical protein [Nostoc favosum]MCC5603786.1 hypothetical protein [Nostoc favosum CHAB5714]
MDYEANQAVNPAGDNATKLALKTLRLFFMPYVLEALGDGNENTAGIALSSRECAIWCIQQLQNHIWRMVRHFELDK